MINKYPGAKRVIPIAPKAQGWVEVTLEGIRPEFTDSELRNLLMLTYLDNPPEFCYRNFVAGLFPDSQVELPTAVGFVDVVTDDRVIEVKQASSWKHALGQVLAYSHVTGKAPAVALFGKISDIARDIFHVQGIEIIEL